MKILTGLDKGVQALVEGATGAALPALHSPAFLPALDDLEVRHPAVYAQVMTALIQPVAPRPARRAASLWRRPVLAGQPVLDLRRVSASLLLCGLAGGLPWLLGLGGSAPPVVVTPTPGVQARSVAPSPALPAGPQPIEVRAPVPSVVVAPPMRARPIPPRPELSVQLAPVRPPRTAVVAPAPAAPTPVIVTRPVTAPRAAAPVNVPDPAPAVKPERRPVALAVPRPVKVNPVKVNPVNVNPVKVERPRVDPVPVSPVPASPVPVNPVPVKVAARPAAAPKAPAAVIAGEPKSPAPAAGVPNLLDDTTDAFSLDRSAGADLNVDLDPAPPGSP